MPSRRSFAAIAATLAFLPLSGRARASDGLIVFAAASLKTALDAVAAAWTAETTKKVKVSYAASSALARQIEHGAPADIFFPADLDWLHYLSGKGLIDAASETRLLGNEIVLIAPRGSTATATIAPGFPLAEILGDGRLAMADVNAVPAGKYGKAALETLGVWDTVSGKLAQAENVRAALKLVAAGEAPLGVVYRTDAEAEPAVTVLDTFPTASHPPIIYPVARVSSSANADAAAFIAFLKSPRAAAVFKAHGFMALP